MSAMRTVKNTCVSLNCPFINYCNEYKLDKDRGDSCDVQVMLIRAAEKCKKDKKKRQMRGVDYE